MKKYRLKLWARDRRKGKFSITEFSITPALVTAIGKHDHDNGTGRYFAIGIVWGHWHIAVALIRITLTNPSPAGIAGVR